MRRLAGLTPAALPQEEYFANDDRVSIDNVDCTQHKDLCQDNGCVHALATSTSDRARSVTGYPTLKSFYAGGELENYRGPREVRAPPLAEAGEVVMQGYRRRS